MSSPMYPRRGDGWRKAGWVAFVVGVFVAVSLCGYGLVKAVERLVTA